MYVLYVLVLDINDILKLFNNTHVLHQNILEKSFFSRKVGEAIFIRKEIRPTL